jgi:hypothetical protein
LSKPLGEDSSKLGPEGCLGWAFSVGRGLGAGCALGVGVGVGVGVVWAGVGGAGVVTGAGGGVAVCGAGADAADFARARWSGAWRTTVLARAGPNSEERTRSDGAGVSASPTGVVWGAVRACDAGAGGAEPCFIPATIA